MNHGDPTFQEQPSLLNEQIAEGGLRIARENGGHQVEIRVIRKLGPVPENHLPLHGTIVEPTGALLDAVRKLLERFDFVGTFAHWHVQGLAAAERRG